MLRNKDDMPGLAFPTSFRSKSSIKECHQVMIRNEKRQEPAQKSELQRRRTNVCMTSSAHASVRIDRSFPSALACSATKHLPNAAICATGHCIPNSIGHTNLSGLSTSTCLAAPRASPGAESA